MIANTFSPRGRRARLTIFSFHQVLEEKDPLRPSEPNVEEFTRDVEKISNTFNVLPVTDAVKQLYEGTLPAAAACVTFDDGYADNHAVAAPILEAAGIPATFFIAGRAVDEGVMWNDLIIETFAQCGADAALEVLPVSVERDDIRASSASSVGDLLDRLKYLPMNERWELSQRLYVESTGSSLPRLMMSRREVADLADRGFEIGGHTLNHPILETIDATQAEQEIGGCYRWVNDVTGRSPTSFAYPNGVPGRDFSAIHQEIVRDAGFDCALSTHWSLAKSDTDRFCIPRVGPWWRQGYGFSSGLARVYLSSFIR